MEPGGRKAPRRTNMVFTDLKEAEWQVFKLRWAALAAGRVSQRSNERRDGLLRQLERRAGRHHAASKSAASMTSRYEARIVRLKQPDAGPLATPFAPEPVDAPCNGQHDGRFQRIPCGSLAVVPAHPVLAPSGDFTVAAYVMPTTPAKGRQAIMGTWCEANAIPAGAWRSPTTRHSPSACGDCPRIDHAQAAAPGKWYLIAASFDARRGTVTLFQEPVTAHGFDSERADHHRTDQQPHPATHPARLLSRPGPAAIRLNPPAGAASISALISTAGSTVPASPPSPWTARESACSSTTPAPYQL